MKKCWEQENAKTLTGRKPEYHPCGSARWIQGEYYCPTDGAVEGYGMQCANIKPAKQMQELTFMAEEDKEMDYIKVTRCEDCKYWECNEERTKGKCAVMFLPDNGGEDSKIMAETIGRDFCSLGRRRTYKPVDAKWAMHEVMLAVEAYKHETGEPAAGIYLSEGLYNAILEDLIKINKATNNYRTLCGLPITIDWTRQGLWFGVMAYEQEIPQEEEP